jgi:hypothetical protein
MLTDDEIADMRATVTESFGDIVTNYRPQAGSDDEGNPTSVWAPVGDPFYGWLQAPQLVGADRSVGSGEAGQALTSALLAPIDVDLRPGDRPVVRAARWRVDTVADVLTHQRCEITKVDR